MKALILAIKKIITVIVAVLVPTSTATPIISNSITTENANTAVVAPREEKEEPQIEIVEEREAEEAAPYEEAQAEADNEPEAVYEAVQTWDVSATDEDNVTMTFYNTEDVEGLLNQLAGRVTALFAPITAYAADEDRTDETDADGIRTITEGNSMIKINPSADELGVEDGEEFGGGAGEDATPIDELTLDELRAMPGTVVVSGNGDMMDYVYNYFMSVDNYIAEYKNAIETFYGVNIIAEYDSEIDDIVELDATIRWRIAGTDTYLTDFSDEFFDTVDAERFLAYSPKAIIVEEGVTNISEAAFAYCLKIERVVLPEGLISIGTSAFECCEGLKNINIPESLETIGDYAFFDCINIEKIVIGENCTSIGYDAFRDCKNLKDIKIMSENIEIANCFYGISEEAVITCFENVEINIRQRELPETVTFEAIENVTE